MQERPNVLWLVVEDMSPYLSFYGNKYTHTPTLDALAKKSIIFEKAYSNGAQCSPARSTLISSIYAPMLATDWHREKRAVPEEYYYPIYLRQAGYYCTNNSKTDYNSSNQPNNIWNESNKKATYLNRPDKNKPFFAVYNYNGTHTQRIATRNTKDRTPRIIDPSSIKLPAYLPDLPAIRDDIAWHYDSVNEMDNWIKARLEELRRSGEAENTIVFFYSDHGGCLPRAKAFVYEVGTKVPLLVHFPDKLKSLAGVEIPSKDNRLVGFVDFAPTLFNLLSIDIPDFMMGQPFLGKNLPIPKKEIFLYRTNQEQNFIPSRALTDGRYRFIWNFNTAYPNGTRQSYQWQMPSYQAWNQAFIEGKTDSIQEIFWKPMEPFEFYDTKNDPYETNNLINASEYQEKINLMRQQLLSFMKKNKDLGLYPWSMRRKEESIPFYEYVRNTNQDVNAVIDAAVISSTAKVKDLQKLEQVMQSENPAVRYWGALGILQLLERRELQNIPEVVLSLFEDKNEETEVRLICAEILVKAQKNSIALDFILEAVESNYYIAFSVLQNLGDLAKPIEKNLIDLLHEPELKKFYIRSALINTGYYQYDVLYK
ncbi:MAG: sulfatase [Bacteroidota bacterium]